LSCQLGDPCWEAATARPLGLTYEADGAFEAAAEWLEEADKRCTRATDPYVALRVEILAAPVEVSQRLGRGEAAVALSREWISLAARAHIDMHVERAAGFLTKERLMSGALRTLKHRPSTEAPQLLLGGSRSS
jgi:hypothetical protein